jgi:hypothetical protein
MDEAEYHHLSKFCGLRKLKINHKVQDLLSFTLELLKYPSQATLHLNQQLGLLHFSRSEIFS